MSHDGVVRRRDKRTWLVVLGVFVGVFIFSFLVQKYKGGKDADAASLAGFDPGYIISDYQMGNYNSMSEAEIQAFLTAKNSCGNRDYNYYVALSKNANYSWHFENGHFICLSEERFGNNDNEIGFQYGETAAHIIWQTAQDYKINPQALIVLLQKETGLITDPIPNNGDYRKATGFGCPDTAACSSKYYGFKNQIRNAAALFRSVLDGGWTNYPLGNNYIQYNPNAACGGSVVNVRSLATSALYRYTPYQPNAGALAAGYGTASCGAYGNRNFYLYFEDWFGGVTKEDGIRRANINEGDYVIESALDFAKAIDVTGGVDAAKNGTNIQLYDKNGTEAQKWHISKNSDGTYTIINPATGKSLDVADGKMDNGANIQLYGSNGTCAQKWWIGSNTDGTYSVFSSCNIEMAIDVFDAARVNGANIQLYRSNGTNAQRWKLDLVKTIEEGEYYVSSEMLRTAVVDISGGAYVAKNETNIQLYEKNGTDAQKWRVKYNADGTYTFINPATGKSLDVAGGKVDDGTNIQLYDSNGTCAQKWRIIRKGTGYVVLSACANMAMSLAKKSSVDNHNNIQINDWVDGDKSQIWRFDVMVPISEGDYVIVSSLSKLKVIDISGGAYIAKNGTNIQLYDKNGTEAQRWRISRNSDGTYSIINPTTGKSLDVAGGRTEDGTNIQLYDSNGTCAQRWWIEGDSGGYEVFSKCSSGSVLDVYGGGINNGANIQLHSSNGTEAQKWKIMRF